MGAAKGNNNNPNGRPVGAKNLVTRAAKEVILEFIDGNADRIHQWVNEIHDKDGAKDALNAYVALLEFAVPKLARTEQKVDGNLNHTFGWSKDE